MDRETVMHMWDEQRSKIAGGDKSSAPRDWFEALLDALDDERDGEVVNEREACAKICEERAESYDNAHNQGLGTASEMMSIATDCANAIRMRSNVR